MKKQNSTITLASECLS